MQNPIFRKVALERLSSPEQLDQLMTVTSPRGWLALVGFGSLLALGLVWSIFATIQVTVPGKGILIQRPTDPATLEAVIYVSLEDGRKIRPGFDVQLALSTVRSDEGLLLGTVTSLAQLPSTQKEMQLVLGNDGLVQSLASAGNLIEVHIALTLDPNTSSGYRWSSLQAPPGSLQAGTLCTGTVVVSAQSPMRLILLRP